MKSWADCSSDEDEDDYSVEAPEEEEEDDDDLVAETSNKLQVKEGSLPAAFDKNEPRQQHHRTYDFPNLPPFTAFVGNLSYDIREASNLQHALADAVQDRLGKAINTVGGQIAYDRNVDNKQHRGFGYVEVETLEELKLVMKLNDDPGAMLAGRKIQVNTANNRSNQRGSFNNGKSNNIDGSKFRGGKYSNKSNNNNTITSHRKNSFRGHNDTQNDRRDKGSFSSKQGGERPSLILAPRSKPIAGTKSHESTSSNIFGSAKARDDQVWEKNRRASQQQQLTQKPKNQRKSVTTDSSQSQTKDDKKTSGEVVEDDNSSSMEKDAVHKNENKTDNDWNSVNPSSANNKTKSGKKVSATHPPERRPSGRGGRSGKTRGSRGSNSGRPNNDNKIDDNNRKMGSGRRQSQQQDKKQKGRRQQSSREEKSVQIDKSGKPSSSKGSDAVASVSQTSSKKEFRTPSNTFALLMESDSE